MTQRQLSDQEIYDLAHAYLKVDQILVQDREDSIKFQDDKYTYVTPDGKTYHSQITVWRKTRPCGSPKIKIDKIFI